MITDYIDHEEATIQSYMRDPEFAEYMLQEAINEGDINEARKIQRRINEAKSRNYWAAIITNAEEAAHNSSNLEAIISLVSKALGILKAAVLTKA